MHLLVECGFGMIRESQGRLNRLMALEWVGIEEAVVLGREMLRLLSLVHMAGRILRRLFLMRRILPLCELGRMSLIGSIHCGVCWKRRKA